MVKSPMPEGSAERKGTPLATGAFDYFPAALAAVARVSVYGNEKHNPGKPLHHNRGKSGDHADALMRHLADRGGFDPETGQRHSAEVAWRALALLQEELEAAGEAPLARAARREASSFETAFEADVGRPPSNLERMANRVQGRQDAELFPGRGPPR